MKKQTRILTIIILITAFLIMNCIPGMAAGTRANINVKFNSINLKVNGSPVQADNILYNDTTYVPLRAIAEMLDKDVGWDAATRTASINDKEVTENVDNSNNIPSTKDVQQNSGNAESVKDTSTHSINEDSGKQSNVKPIISYDYGHMEGGSDGSAKGILYEYQVVREYGEVCIKYLEAAGIKCINCTPPDGKMTLMGSLEYRVKKANESGSNLHLCFHANCFNGKAHGAEIEVASDAGEKIAKPVLEKICSLGFINRGVKRPDLYVTNYTKMTCLLFEPFFIDNEEDVALYDPEKLGRAIAEGILEYYGIPLVELTRSINVVLNSINITVNGYEVKADNILYNDTTYVPLRAIAEMLNKNVEWDANTRTASINDLVQENNNLQANNN